MTIKQEYRIGEHISLRLEDINPNSYRDWTVIYVNKKVCILVLT